MGVLACDRNGCENIIFLTFLLSLSLIAGCANAEHEDIIQIGESLQVNDERRTIDRRRIHKDFPLSFVNQRYLGGGWITFEYKGKCFLLADHGRSAVMAAADVCSDEL